MTSWEGYATRCEPPLSLLGPHSLLKQVDRSLARVGWAMVVPRMRCKSLIPWQSPRPHPRPGSPGSGPFLTQTPETPALGATGCFIKFTGFFCFVYYVKCSYRMAAITFLGLSGPQESRLQVWWIRILFLQHLGKILTE